MSGMCIYCKREDDCAICLHCDGKHVARKIHQLVEREKTLYYDRGLKYLPPDGIIKKKVMLKQIKGIDGLSRHEKQSFWDAFNREYQVQERG